MAYLKNMRKTCKDRATNPEWPLDLIDSIKGEFDKGLAPGGTFDPGYVLEKLNTLTRHVKWLDQEATKEFQAEYA